LIDKIILDIRGGEVLITIKIIGILVNRGRSSMKLSTRARYGVRLMLVLAVHYGKGPVYLKDIARGEEISEKYLSLIIIPLRTAGLVHSTRGAYGGYYLARDPSQINLKDILDILEGETCLVDCVRDPSLCSRVPNCVSREIWCLLGGRIAEVLGSISLLDLVRMNKEKLGNEAASGI
jgi:Rrf2 family protein